MGIPNHVDVFTRIKIKANVFGFIELLPKINSGHISGTNLQHPQARLIESFWQIIKPTSCETFFGLGIEIFIRRKGRVAISP